MKVKDLGSRQLRLFMRGARGLNRMDDESNESMYGKFGMSFKSEGRNCGVLEVVKYRTLN